MRPCSTARSAREPTALEPATVESGSHVGRQELLSPSHRVSEAVPVAGGEPLVVEATLRGVGGGIRHRVLREVSLVVQSDAEETNS